MTQCPDHLVPVEQLQWTCDPTDFQAASTDQVTSDRVVIGQDRALKALKLGIEVRSPGYNIYVSGLSGTGRMTAVRRMLVGLSDSCVTVPDKAFVHNFEDPSQPRLLELARGQVRKYQQAMAEFARSLQRDLQDLFESEIYLAQRRHIEDQQEEPQRLAFEVLADEARLAGLAVVQVKSGSFIRPGIGIPLEKDQVAPIEALHSLISQGRFDEEKGELLRNNAEQLQVKLDRAVVDAREAQRKLAGALEEFDRSQARKTFEDDLQELSKQFPDACVQRHLEQVNDAVQVQLELFRNPEDEEGEPHRQTFLRMLSVNVILDNGHRDDTPVVVEANPSFNNLFGTVEHRMTRGGDVMTDHTKVRAGSLVAADGGYLILSVEDVLQEPGVWQTLKRVLKTDRLEIQPRSSAMGIAPLMFKPQAIPLQVKVILIGGADLYSMLYTNDSDFHKSFKIRADFDSVMERSQDNIQRFPVFLARLAEREQLLPMDATAMARMVEDAARRTDHGGKISTRFSEIADLARESNHFAITEGAAQVSASHVNQALADARERDDLYDQKLEQRILDGTVMIDTEGAIIGQVNGLAVYRSGTYSFGKPSRITATVSAGDSGILNIEREVEMSGEIHDKGVLIMTSFMRERFGQNHPLALCASICFEQNYSGVDGDSASSTELYALLSSLSGTPIHQGIAVTGSVNQKGDIQPIGGINEKVEGFFRICQQRGLDGSQGVLLPIQNVSDLMLDAEVVEAVKADKFHLWAVSHVDQGIEVMTGVAMGQVDDKGEYPDGSIGHRVARRFLELAEVARDFKGSSTESESEKDA